MDDLLLRRREMMLKAKDPSIVYSLYNYTCDGTDATRFDTGIKLFNTSSFPNGFELNLVAVITKESSELPYRFPTWVTCMDESGSPWPGLTIRQSGINQTPPETKCQVILARSTSAIASTQATGISAGDTVRVKIKYNKSSNTTDNNGIIASVSGQISCNATLLVGGSKSNSSTWFSDRNGYVYIKSLTIKKL